MLINVEHPAIVKGTTPGGDRWILGRMRSLIEVAELSATEAPLAFTSTKTQYEGPLSIRSRAGMLFKANRRLSIENFGPREYFWKTLMTGTHRDFQPFTAVLLREVERIGMSDGLPFHFEAPEMTAREIKLKKPPLEKAMLTAPFLKGRGRWRDRYSADVDLELDLWRGRLQAFVNRNVFLVDGVFHERCQEPCYKVRKGLGFDIGELSGYGSDPEDRRRDSDGLIPMRRIGGDDEHRFSALQREEALSFAASIGHRRWLFNETDDLIAVHDPSLVSAVEPLELRYFAGEAIRFADFARNSRWLRNHPLVAPQKELIERLRAFQDGEGDEASLVSVLRDFVDLLFEHRESFMSYLHHERFHETVTLHLDRLDGRSIEIGEVPVAPQMELAFG